MQRIGVVLVPPIDELDLIGPLQVFNCANRLLNERAYSVELITTEQARDVPGESGLVTFLAGNGLDRDASHFDAALIVCGLASRTRRDPRLITWIRRAAKDNRRRVGAVCVGAFLLAEAGVLDERRATAHWRFASELARRYPRVRVESDATWTSDGNIYTSAGISAGIDLALAWVEEDHGSAIAHEAARELVLYLRRPSGQKQLSVSLALQATEMRAISDLKMWIEEHIDERISVAALARRASMSTRTFERTFTREVGTTPAHYLVHVRVEAARRQLERSSRGLKEIASATGFGSADAMRKAFVRLIGLTPRAYRTRCQTPAGIRGGAGTVIS